jgi:salicylate hydroxylase
MYCFADPECGSDVEKIVANARERFRWIWEVDLWDEVQRAERKFKELQEEYRGFLR